MNGPYSRCERLDRYLSSNTRMAKSHGRLSGTVVPGEVVRERGMVTGLLHEDWRPPFGLWVERI